jgi:hypothetical protein
MEAGGGNIEVRVHCKEILIYVFPEKDCADSVLISTFMYVPVSDLYIPTIDLPIFHAAEFADLFGNI